MPNFTNEQNLKTLIRSIENNDWIIFTLIGVASVYAIIFRILNKNQSFSEYMKLSIEYEGNIIMNWIVSGFVYVLVLSVLLFEYIQAVPDFITENINLYGYTLNKFWFLFIVSSVFYIVKSLFMRLFFVIIGDKKGWKKYVFTVNKLFYFVAILICLFIVIYHFYPVNQDYFFNMLIVFFVLSFLAKNIFLVIGSNKALLGKWYHKFLYICTLQILPHFVVWWFLFFQYYR